MRTRKLIAALMVGAAIASGCGTQSVATPLPSMPGQTTSAGATDRPDASATASASSTPEAVVLLAAGDIGDCAYEGAAGTAEILADYPDATVAALGDLAYPSATAEQFDACYDPYWGPFVDRTRPAIGNHDLDADGGAPYYDTFGDDAGTPGEGWYSYDLGSWHAVVLNSNCDYTPCEEGSAQHAWLVADLAASDAECTVAYFHNPRFTSGPHGDDPRLDPFWQALADAGVDVVLVGHDHHYERFTPLDADGASAADGVRQFIVGTGGTATRPTVRVAPGSEFILDDGWGVLRLELGAETYAWSFLTVDGRAADTGEGQCH